MWVCVGHARTTVGRAYGKQKKLYNVVMRNKVAYFGTHAFGQQKVRERQVFP